VSHEYRVAGLPVIQTVEPRQAVVAEIFRRQAREVRRLENGSQAMPMRGAKFFSDGFLYHSPPTVRDGSVRSVLAHLSRSGWLRFRLQFNQHTTSQVGNDRVPFPQANAPEGFWEVCLILGNDKRA
jgi:hypothetical protein